MSAPAVAAGPTAAGATAARPATTRVTILTGRRMTDLVLPAAVPMETYIDDTVAVLSEVLEDTPADVLGGFDFTAQGVWAFARPGSPPLKLTRGGPRKRHELASFAVITAIAVIAAAAAFGYGYQDWVPAGGIAFGLFIVTNAAKLTVAVARIALPPIPVPGETVDNEELLDPVATPEATSEETPTWQAIIASVPASAVRLTERSKLAKQLLIGYVTSGTLILAAGAIAVVVRGHFFVHSLVVAGLITTVCGFRSRLYAERWCAWALLAATVAIPTGLTAKLIIWYPHYAWLLLSVYLTVALVALVVVGSMAHVRRVSPVVKRTLELIDGAMIAAIIPMLLWITGVYDTVRNIRF